jgi:hypothetical protein
MKYVELKPVRRPQREFDRIEDRIRWLFKDEFYSPLIAELGGHTDSATQLIKNSVDDLLDAIASGRVTFYRGHFNGKFNAVLSRELRRLGAKWDSKNGSYAISQARIPKPIREAIDQSLAKFQKVAERITTRLKKFVPGEIADNLDLSKTFDTMVYKTDNEIHDSMKGIPLVAPKLTDKERKKIVSEYTENMQKDIKGWLEEEVIALRKMLEPGMRGGERNVSRAQTIHGVIKTLGKSYNNAENKAKFLARQETNLYLCKLKEIRYQAAGVDDYKWFCVIASPAHPVRPRHQELNDQSRRGKTFKFSEPPVTTEPGQKVRKNNAGEDFNCIPGSTIVELNQSIHKLFRRVYSGELTLLVSDNGMRLESTGNHPILTNRGWIETNKIQIGDYIFKRVGERFDGREVNGEDVEASIEEVFNALSLCSEVGSRPLSSSDFHGDVPEHNQVNVITVDRELCLSRISKFYKILSEFSLQGPYEPTLASGPIYHSLIAWRLTPDSIVSFLGELQAFLNVHLAHTDDISLRSGSPSDFGLDKPASDNVSRDHVFSGNGKLTHPFLVILDRIFIRPKFIPGFRSSLNLNATSAEVLAQNVSTAFKFKSNFCQTHISRFVHPLRVVYKAVRQSSCHVYNLETKTHWYEANGVIIHNCRCIAIPIVRFK